MSEKLTGHALENYNMVKKILDSGKTKEDIKKDLTSLEFKGGSEMKEKAVNAIKKEMENHDGYDVFKLMLELL